MGIPSRSPLSPTGLSLVIVATQALFLLGTSDSDRRFRRFNAIRKRNRHLGAQRDRLGQFADALITFTGLQPL